MVFTVLDRAVDVVLIRLGYKKRPFTDVSSLYRRELKISV